MAFTPPVGIRRLLIRLNSRAGREIRGCRQALDLAKPGSGGEWRHGGASCSRRQSARGGEEDVVLPAARLSLSRDDPAAGLRSFACLLPGGPGINLHGAFKNNREIWPSCSVFLGAVLRSSCSGTWPAGLLLQQTSTSARVLVGRRLQAQRSAGVRPADPGRSLARAARHAGRTATSARAY